MLMALMIGGFVETVDAAATAEAAFYPEFATVSCFSSKKPSFESGAAISLAKKTTTAASTTSSALPLKKYVYALGNRSVMMIFL